MHKLYAYALIILVQLFFLAGCGGSGGSATVPPNTTPAPNSWNAGNPDGSCTSASIPPEGLAVDTSAPTTVVGTGTTGSCTFAALNTAIKAGGVITFNCGTNPVTIPVTATLNIQPDRNTVIDGGKLITLDGGGAVQIMSFNGPSYQTNNYRLTLQHIALINGKTTPTIKTTASKTGVPAPCSQGYNDGEGGALYMSDGNLSVIDSIFTGNQAAQVGPDTGGGAIYVQGSKNGIVIEGSTFSNNSASNAGAVGGLQAELKIYNSLFSNNTATGYGENYIDSTCPTNNGQTEAGSGGNGGAIYSDGVLKNVFLCGNKIVNNHAGADGGGLFFTSNNWVGMLSIFDTIMTGNTYLKWWAQVGLNNYLKTAGTAVATNCGGLNVQNSTLQGVP